MQLDKIISVAAANMQLQILIRDYINLRKTLDAFTEIKPKDVKKWLHFTATPPTHWMLGCWAQLLQYCQTRSFWSELPTGPFKCFKRMALSLSFWDCNTKQIGSGEKEHTNIKSGLCFDLLWGMLCLLFYPVQFATMSANAMTFWSLATKTFWSPSGLPQFQQPWTSFLQLTL